MLKNLWGYKSNTYYFRYFHT